MSAPRITADLDAAVAGYWRNRPLQSRPALVEHRRRVLRQRTPVEVWLRRAGVAA